VPDKVIDNDRAVKLNSAWLAHLESEFSQDYMQNLRQFLRNEKSQGKQIFPPGEQIFNALNTTPLGRVKVVILGQDPYHGPGQAHGLCFSVLPGVAVPPSLKNIFKELKADLGVPTPSHGYLQSWAEQGVLLLNAVLTVEKAMAASHQGKGWEQFTDKVVEVVNQNKEQVVFLLWGSYAQKKGLIIDRKRHNVLQSTHPSPLSAYRGFLGCQHFSQVNQYLEKTGQLPIDWTLPKL
jgi:uracil-DNA glycosylase